MLLTMFCNVELSCVSISHWPIMYTPSVIDPRIDNFRLLVAHFTHQAFWFTYSAQVIITVENTSLTQ